MRYISFLLIIICHVNCSTEPESERPIINSISILKYATKQDTVFRGDVGIELECDSYDKDGFIADYIWEATGGNIQGAANHARWDAPTSLPGTYYIICTVKDNDDNIARKEFGIYVYNRKPIIRKIEIYPESFGEHNPNLTKGTDVQIITFIDNPENDDHEFKYILPDSTTDWMWQILFWRVSENLPPINKVYALVRDQYGAVSIDSLEFYIH